MGANDTPNENKSKMHLFLQGDCIFVQFSSAEALLSAKPSDPLRRRPCLPEGFGANVTQLLSDLKVVWAKKVGVICEIGCDHGSCRNASSKRPEI